MLQLSVINKRAYFLLHVKMLNYLVVWLALKLQPELHNKGRFENTNIDITIVMNINICILFYDLR